MLNIEVIETTTFSIPTFLLDGLVFAGVVISAWVVLISVAVAVYIFMEK